MEADFFQKILNSVINWVSSGPWGVLAGIAGGLGVLFVLRLIGKKITDAAFQKKLTDVSQTAGNVSAEASLQMEENDRLINSIFSEEKIEPEQPKKPDEQPPKKPEVPKNLPSIEVPANGTSNVLFDVITENVPEGTTIFAERTWELGKVSSSGITSVSIQSPGNRIIEVQVKGVWYSCPIMIEE